MLGVLKRRLKPKRAGTERESQTSRRNVHNKSEAIVPVDVARIAPSQRQIHPLFEDKAQLLAYDDNNTNAKKSTPTPNLKKSPDDSPLLLPKKPVPEPVFASPTPSPTTPTSPFHPAPNICVEGGRIEFIKSPSEGSNLAAMNPPRGSLDKRTRTATLSQYAAVPQIKSVNATRAHRTQPETEDCDSIAEEKCDVAKEFLEARIKELQRLLESEQKTVQRERLAVTRLQRQLARRDATQRDVDRERRLRADTESRLRETVGESERYRATLAGLQREFSKMEDTVRTMLQYKTRCELLNQEKVFLTAAYENRVHQYQNTITKLGQENESLKQQVFLLESTGTGEVPAGLLDRLRSLETENTHLSRDAEFQRKQYERCLDDIANQVVRALLSQKGLREEIGNLQRRIKELENQNHALANILIHKLDNQESVFALPSTDDKPDEEKVNPDWFPGSFSFKGANLCPDSPTSGPKCERKRLRRLHFSDLGDKNILKSMSSFESLVVVPLQRPRSLNLHLYTSPMALSAASSVTSKRCQNKKSKLNIVTLSKKPSEDEGNESPESGNRDEGYSTMSSDVQGPGETNDLSKRELEDLKEASDETDVILDSNGEITSIVVVEDAADPDIIFIPLNLSLAINSRHSYPPSKTFLPFHHIMRSFSDSHLCLKVTATAATSIASPLSPSLFLVDVIDKNHPLRRSKATSSLPYKKGEEKDVEDSQSSSGSWCSGAVEGCWWDTEYVQHWLKLDDSKLKQQRDVLQLQYDRTEIEEWSMSLSCEDIAKSVDGDFAGCRKLDANTPGTLPSIQENESNNIEVDSNEWNDYSAINLTIDTKTEGDAGNWSYEKSGEKSTWQMTSPGGSWSSASTNNSEEECCRSLNDCYFNDCSGVESKGSPAGSDEIEESSAVGIDFTRDFYRLVKFESTKSLASNSSRSNGNCDLATLNEKQSEFAQDRELALQNVLSFIVEQQKYCHAREEEDDECESYCRPSSFEELRINGKDHPFDDLEPRLDIPNVDRFEQNHQSEADLGISDNTAKAHENVSSREPVAGSRLLNKPSHPNEAQQNQSKPEKEISTKLPVRNSKCVQRKDKIQRTENFTKCLETTRKAISDCGKKIRRESSPLKETCESEPEVLPPKPQLSRLSSPARVRETGIPVFTTKKTEENAHLRQKFPEPANVLRPRTNPRVRGTKIPVISARKSESVALSKPKHLDLPSPKPSSSKETNIPVPRRPEASRLPSKKATPPDSKAVVIDDTSFHEKATTKDVIDELNRMIRKGDEITPSTGDGELSPLDMACCCPTGWVHVERDIDFTDPKARANLLDVMLASSGSSGGSGSSSDSGGDEPVDYTHLHRLHRFRRQRKASATREQLGVLRYPLPSARPTIIGRENFFVRYGDKEKEAVASFDFLEDISTTSPSGCSSCDSLESNQSTCLKSAITPTELASPEIDICTPVTPTTPITPSDDSDERTGGPVSLSDSCADSYSESMGSLED